MGSVGFPGRRRGRPALRIGLLTLFSVIAAACASAGRDPDGAAAARDFAYRVQYYVSCSVSDECRVQYIDEDGVLRARDIVGEWDMDFGADPGTRLWLRAGAGGCPPRPVRAEIRMDGDLVAEHLAPAPRRSRCSWILAETEFRLP
ncbi:hypothetical protein [Candidatus Palauibacter sp.]|uniref:hypothetical protein n=1 Tax=Candidatus Palauibacter sp. TaxID=3101350 RepID=UPI003B01679F